MGWAASAGVSGSVIPGFPGLTAEVEGSGEESGAVGGAKWGGRWRKVGREVETRREA
ncbi:Uncharacterised protein [Mycobacteroides abscessus subsp. abscessus]|nr:Uncharacterised protein [Mycobacteroides abscessus subsp. abscessus]